MKSPRTTTTLGDLHRATPWLWLYCEKCPHSAPLDCAVTAKAREVFAAAIKHRPGRSP
jgi:hypothetical protein